MHIISYLFYLWNSTLHVSDGLSVHHQESKTVHTALGIMSYGFCCLLASGNEMEHLVPASKQITEPVQHIPNALCTVLDS